MLFVYVVMLRLKFSLTPTIFSVMMKSLWYPHRPVFLLGVLSLGCSLTLGVALSRGANAEVIKTENPHFVLFEPPTDRTLNDSRGGASRPGEVKCLEDEAYPFPLTALIPQSGLGLTANPHPTLLVYVPPTTATQAHFTLRDSNQQGLYQTQLPIAPTGGILNITLPADSPALSVGSHYQWSLGLLCQTPQTDMPIASGQIQRVDAPEIAAVANQPLWLQAKAYGQAGIWYDMLASLVALQQPERYDSGFSGEISGEMSDEARREPSGEARREASDDLSHDWARLLEAEQLGAIAHSPFFTATIAPSSK